MCAERPQPGKATRIVHRDGERHSGHRTDTGNLAPASAQLLAADELDQKACAACDTHPTALASMSACFRSPLQAAHLRQSVDGYKSFIRFAASLLAWTGLSQPERTGCVRPLASFRWHFEKKARQPWWLTQIDMGSRNGLDRKTVCRQHRLWKRTFDRCPARRWRVTIE